MITILGCATGRIEDLKDCGSFSVGGGLGLEMTGKLGCVLHPSIGVISSTWRVGHEDRYFSGVWKDATLVWPFSAVLESIGELRHPPFIFISYFRESYLNNTNRHVYSAWWMPFHEKEIYLNKAYQKPYSFHELTDLEFGTTAIFPSVRMGVNPLEIVDFSLGFVGKDIAGDDIEKEIKNKPKEPNKLLHQTATNE